MIDLATVDAASAMFVATTCSGVACGIIGYIVGSVRQSAHDSAVMDSLRTKIEKLRVQLEKKPKVVRIYVEPNQGFNRDLITNNQWLKETANNESTSTGEA